MHQSILIDGSQTWFSNSACAQFLEPVWSPPPVSFSRAFALRLKQSHSAKTLRRFSRKNVRRVITRQMPPWHIDPTVGVQQFKNDMSLTQSQIDTIVSWVDQGAPQGDAKDMPAPRQWLNA